METKDEKRSSPDGKTTLKTPLNGAKTDGNGARYPFTLPLNYEPILVEMMKVREEDKQYIDYLERDVTRLNHIINHNERTISKLVGKRAQLYAANKILQENGLLM